jgi:hypothetical protein
MGDCEIVYVNSEIIRIGYSFLTSHLHTISPCHLMSCHLAGDTLLGGDSLSPCITLQMCVKK